MVKVAFIFPIIVNELPMVGNHLQMMKKDKLGGISIKKGMGKKIKNKQSALVYAQIFS